MVRFHSTYEESKFSSVFELFWMIFESPLLAFWFLSTVGLLSGIITCLVLLRKVQVEVQNRTYDLEKLDYLVEHHKLELFNKKLKESMPHSYKLVTFNLPGRGDLPKLLLKLTGANFTHRAINPGEWNPLKTYTPFGELPLLILDDEKMMSQTDAICRFIAREHNIVGRDAWESAVLDGYIESMWNFVKCMVTMKQLEIYIHRSHCKSPDQEYMLAKNFSLNYEKFMKTFEQALKKNGNNGHLMGNAITWGDALLYYIMNKVFSMKNDSLENYPSIQEFMNNMKEKKELERFINTDQSVAEGV